MKVRAPHSWDVSPEQAKAIQEDLREEVVREPTFDEVTTVAGVDMGLEGDTARSAIVVLNYPSLAPIDQAIARVPIEFPYIPGLLAFREAPAILAALEELTTEPDLFIFDGHGLAHPRRMGIAGHVGVILDKPSIGCAKSRLVGEHQEPGQEKGSYTHLYDGNEVIGAVVRSRTDVSPIFVSIGHRIDLESAIEYVLGCTPRYRLPETTRLADRVAGGEGLGLEGNQQSFFDQI